MVDPVRCLRLGTYGLLLDGPLGHMWYRVLDKNVSPPALMRKPDLPSQPIFGLWLWRTGQDLMHTGPSMTWWRVSSVMTVAWATSHAAVALDLPAVEWTEVWLDRCPSERGRQGCRPTMWCRCAQRTPTA